jgi:hypothetical protein
MFYKSKTFISESQMREIKQTAISPFLAYRQQIQPETLP